MALAVRWTGLDQAGHCNTEKWMALLQPGVTPFGRTRLKALLADPELVAQRGFAWLQAQGIPFQIRLKGNTLIPHCWHEPMRARVLFSSLTRGQSRPLPGRRPVWGCLVDLSGLRLTAGDFLIVASSAAPPPPALTAYGRRWEPETLFGALKSRGFKFEDTHLTYPERLGTLLALLALALAWTYRSGEALAAGHPSPLQQASRVLATLSSAMASTSAALWSLTWPTAGLIS